MVEKIKYRMTFKCSCGNVFKKITSNPDLMEASCPQCRKKEKTMRLIRMGDGAVQDSDLKIKKENKAKKPNSVYYCEDCDNKIRVFLEIGKTLSRCPFCNGKNIVLKCTIDNNPPITESSKTRNKAVDETARICMDDYKMGDLKDKSYVGESVAPPLHPRLQKQVDGFFSSKKQNSIPGINAAGLARAAMSGAYRPGGSSGNLDSVAIAQSSKKKISPNVIASYDGRKN